MRRAARLAFPAVALATLLVVSACADPNDRNQRALAGGAAGAGAGALIGSLTGSAGRGALIGGALGTLVGALTPPPNPEAIPDTPRLAQPYHPALGGWYDQYGQWHPGGPPTGYQGNYK